MGRLLRSRPVGARGQRAGPARAAPGHRRRRWRGPRPGAGGHAGRGRGRPPPGPRPSPRSTCAPLAEHQRTGQARASHGFDAAALTRSEVAANLSLELGISLTAADLEVRFALALARHPQFAVALATGRIHAAQARAIVSELSALGAVGARPPGPRAGLRPRASPAATSSWSASCAARAPGCWDLPIAKLKTVIRREAAQLDPDSVTDRTTAGRTDRSVRYYSGPDSVAELVLRGPEEQLTAVIAHLDATAARVQRAGEPGTLDQLRFDIAIGSLTEGTFGLHVVQPARPAVARQSARTIELPPHSGPLINVTAPAATLAGGNEPGVLHGPDGDVPLPAEVVRELGLRPRQRHLADGPLRSRDRPGAVDLAHLPAEPGVAGLRRLPRRLRLALPDLDGSAPDRVRPHRRVRPQRPGGRRLDQLGQPGRRGSARAPAQNRPRLLRLRRCRRLSSPSAPAPAGPTTPSRTSTCDPSPGSDSTRRSNHPRDPRRRNRHPTTAANHPSRPASSSRSRARSVLPARARTARCRRRSVPVEATSASSRPKVGANFIPCAAASPTTTPSCPGSGTDREVAVRGEGVKAGLRVDHLRARLPAAAC